MDKYEVQEIKVSLSEIPSTITAQLEKLEVLQKNVKKAVEKAEKAKQSADIAHEKSAGAFRKKEAIESLQSATVDLAESQISSSEAHKLSFDYQKELGEVTKYLFALGVGNLAANRTVVRELELRLKDASEEELSGLARQEIVNVVKQLKLQEDILNKQNELAQKIKQHEKELAVQQAVDVSLEKELLVQAEKDREHDRLLAERVDKDVEQDKVMEEQAEKDKEHDRLLAVSAEKDEEHDRLLAERVDKDVEQDEVMKEQAEKDKEHDKLLQELQRENVELSRKIESNLKAIEELRNSKSEKNATYISYIVAVVALMLAAIQFFI